MAITDLDAHQQPSDSMKAKWKSYSKMDASAFIDNTHIDDPRAPISETGFQEAGVITAAQLQEAFAHIDPTFSEPVSDVPILFHPLLPGLLITPSLVPASIQTTLLEKMLHRDLSNQAHQTNLHLHYDLPYPPSSQSFFTMDPESPVTFPPKDPAVHKPLSARQVLQRKLHWVTLGGQYDWTNRVYPDAQPPPPFPPDLSQFLQALFPQTTAQAAIVNFYTPGDTMMMHRDVSEFTDKGLVSLSLGCDGLFMVAPNGCDMDNFGSKADTEKEFLLLKLRSGDGMYMMDQARFAWHGVPKVLPGTCPDHLQDWPATEDGQYDQWRGWMKNKRVNLNVRQVHD